MHRKNRPLVYQNIAEMHIHVYGKVLFISFCNVCVTMDVIKNRNFCPSRLLAVYAFRIALHCEIVIFSVSATRKVSHCFIDNNTCGLFAPEINRQPISLSTYGIWRILAIARRNRDIKLKGINALNFDTLLLNLYYKLTSAVSNTPIHDRMSSRYSPITTPKLNNSIFAFDSVR